MNPNVGTTASRVREFSRKNPLEFHGFKVQEDPQEFIDKVYKGDLNMDSIVGLPRTRRQHDSIWVVVDRMTKSAHLLRVKVSYSANDYAKLYLRELVKLHGVTLSFIHDRGTQFTSPFWMFFQKSLGAPVKLSTTFHPQIDGQADCSIQILDDMLRTCVIDFNDGLGAKDNLSYEEVPVEILDHPLLSVCGPNPQSKFLTTIDGRAEWTVGLSKTQLVAVGLGLAVKLRDSWVFS
ncbi:hypothetical protein MTR67_002139 [Solanum verrucosum]|uniref:Integrase catalytic domain-containing protein n=1 Tax=Solanum verrucosum TaxID=315347 RepID=A0AAF0T8H0_SOLVR|nr:hypothetical protein MTR67_002139 [Solanum verrucosum]